MVKDIIHGKMVDHIKEDILMIKSMDMAYILGLMVESMKGNGIVENNMAEDSIFYLIDQ